MMHGQRNIKSVYMFFLPERTSWRKLGTFHTAMLFWKFRRTAYKCQRQSHPCSDLLQTLRVPGGWGSQISRQSAYEFGKVVSPTHRPSLPLGNAPGTYFCWGRGGLSRPQGQSAAGRTMSKFQWYQTRDLPACSAVPQPNTAPGSAQDKNVFPHISLTMVK